MSLDRPGSKSLTWWPIAGAAIIAVLAVVLVLTLSQGGDGRVGARTDSSGALECPADYQQQPPNVGDSRQGWVPIQATGVDGSESLVPPVRDKDSAPLHATVCAYDAAGTDLASKAQVRLSGSRTVRGTAALARQLSTAPKATTPPSASTCRFAPGSTDYLIGLVYSTGKIWVSVPSSDCRLVANGQYATSDDLRAKTRTAFTTRTWD